MVDSTVWSKVDGLDKNSAMKLVAYMEEQPAWFLSHRKQVNVLIQKIGRKIPKRYVKDYTQYPINQQAKNLYKENFDRIFKTNPVAKEVRTPKFKSKVIDSKKIYDRKKEQDELRESYEQSVRNRLERINDE